MGSRRHTLRLHCDLPARWTSQRSAGEAHVLDISAGGLLLGGVGDLSPGDHVDLDVDLGDRRVQLGAQVRFVGTTRHGPGCGVALDGARNHAVADWRAHYQRLADHAIDSAPISVRQYLRRRTEPG